MYARIHATLWIWKLCLNRVLWTHVAVHAVWAHVSRSSMLYSGYMITSTFLTKDNWNRPAERTHNFLIFLLLMFLDSGHYSELFENLCCNPCKQFNPHIIILCRSLPYTQPMTSVSKQAMRSRLVPLGPYMSISLKRWSPPWERGKYTQCYFGSLRYWL